VRQASLSFAILTSCEVITINQRLKLDQYLPDLRRYWELIHIKCDCVISRVNRSWRTSVIAANNEHQGNCGGREWLDHLMNVPFGSLRNEISVWRTAIIPRTVQRIVDFLGTERRTEVYVLRTSTTDACYLRGIDQIRSFLRALTTPRFYQPLRGNPTATAGCLYRVRRHLFVIRSFATRPKNRMTF